MKRIVMMMTMIVLLSACTKENEDSVFSNSCTIHYKDYNGDVVTVDATTDTIEDIMNGLDYDRFFVYEDSHYTEMIDKNSCVNDVVLYGEPFYYEYNLTVYGILEQDITVEDIYEEDGQYIYTTVDHKIFAPLFSYDPNEKVVVDITKYFYFSEGEWIEDVVFTGNMIYLLSTEHRLFAVDLYKKASTYFVDDYIPVQFISENIRKVIGDYGIATALSMSNNVYTMEINNEGYVSTTRLEISEYFDKTIIDMFGIYSDVLYVTDDDLIMYCSKYSFTENDILTGNPYVSCNRVKTTIPFDDLYLALKEQGTQFTYNNVNYTIYSESVNTLDTFMYPVDYDDVVFDVSSGLPMIKSLDAFYVYSYQSQDYLDITSLIPVTNNEEITGAFTVGYYDELVVVVYTNNGNIYYSNMFFEEYAHTITTFYKLSQDYFIDGEVVKKVFSSNDNINVLFGSGEVSSIRFDEGEIISNVVFEPMGLTKHEFVYNRKSDLSILLGEDLQMTFYRTKELDETITLEEIMKRLTDSTIYYDLNELDETQE